MAFSSECLYEIWDDEDGTHWEVGPDRDDLGMIEIRCKDREGKIGDRLAMPKEAAFLVAKALNTLTEMC